MRVRKLTLTKTESTLILHAAPIYKLNTICCEITECGRTSILSACCDWDCSGAQFLPLHVFRSFRLSLSKTCQTWMRDCCRHRPTLVVGVQMLFCQIFVYVQWIGNRSCITY